MSFTPDEIVEFKTEAEELFESAERSLLALDRGESFPSHYDSIFRTFHSVKGAAGMMEFMDLQGHMHQLENLLTSQKEQSNLPKPYIDLFLKGMDAARTILSGQQVSFDFTVSQAAPVAAHSPKPVPPPEPETAQKRGRVIVLDDEPELMELLSDILTQADFEVLGSSEPQKILEMVKQFKPDMILTDIMMPQMTGVQVLTAVKETNPDLPVIFISGHVSKESLLEAINLGVHGVIEKPFDVKHVVVCCRQAVQRFHTSSLLNKSINLIMYQFSDLNDFLKHQGKEDIRKVISQEINTLLDQRRRLRQAA